MIDPTACRPEELAALLFERLNGWHLELSIVSDAIGHVLAGIEEPEGLSATAYVLRKRLDELVGSCPFPGDAP